MNAETMFAIAIVSLAFIASTGIYFDNKENQTALENGYCQELAHNGNKLWIKCDEQNSRLNGK